MKSYVLDLNLRKKCARALKVACDDLWNFGGSGRLKFSIGKGLLKGRRSVVVSM